jgi:hypothetical protein
MTLPADGAGRAVEHGGNVAQAVVLLQQAGHGHAVFGLELLVAAGRGGHLLTLQGLQVLHFTFESALLKGAGQSINPSALDAHKTKKPPYHEDMGAGWGIGA